MNRRIGRTGYYVLMILYKFKECKFDTIRSFLYWRGITRKSITHFLQRYPELVGRRKDGRFNWYFLTEEGKRLFEEGFMKDQMLRLELERLEEGKWYDFK